MTIDSTMMLQVRPARSCSRDDLHLIAVGMTVQVSAWTTTQQAAFWDCFCEVYPFTAEYATTWQIPDPRPFTYGDVLNALFERWDVAEEREQWCKRRLPRRRKLP